MGSTFDAVQDLMKEILTIQKENSRNVAAMERIQEIVEKSSSLVEQSESTREMIVDAKILHTGSQFINSNITSFDTNLTSFDEAIYTKGVLSFIDKNFKSVNTENPWHTLAPNTYKLYKKSNSNKSMIGVLSLDPSCVKEIKKREKSKKLPEKKIEVRPCAQEHRVREELADNIYDHILRSLVTHYKINNKEAIPFIDFVIDPTSYWRSIENIFHFSFLIQDGSVHLFLNDDGLPVVKPISKKKVGNELHREGKNHFSFTLSKKDWKKCITKFDITSSKIEPPSTT